MAQQWQKGPPIAGVNGTVPDLGTRYWGTGEYSSTSNVLLKSNDVERAHKDLGYSVISEEGGYVAGPFRISFEGADDQHLLVRTSEGRTLLEFFSLDGELNVRHSVDGVATKARVIHNKNEYYVGLGTDAENILVYYNYITSRVRFKSYGLAAEVGDLSISVSVNTETDRSSEYRDGDVFVYYVTEYDSETDIESLPVAIGSVPQITNGRFERYEGNVLNALVQIPVVSPQNSRADKFKMYRAYLGNQNDDGVTPGDVQAFFDYERFDGGQIAQFEVLSFVLDRSTIDFFETRANSGATYPQTVIGLDNGLALYPTPRQPEVFDLGTSFNDSIVTNAPGTSAQIMRYSPPGSPEYQPTPYFMYFATDRSDEIVGIEQLGGRLIVLMTGGISRVNYLPTSDDFNALRGRVQTSLTNTYGCVGREAWTRVDTAQGSFLTWLSNRGLEFTVGDGVDDACPDFRSELLTGTLEDAVLVNNQKLQRLELYSGLFRWDFYYHPSHVKNGRFKLMGPTQVGFTAIGAFSDEDTVYVLSQDTFYKQQSEGGGASSMVLGRFFNDAAPYYDWELTGFAFQATGAGELTCTTIAADTGDANSSVDSIVSDTVEWTEDGTYKVEFHNRGKIIRCILSIAGEDWSIGPTWWRMDATQADAS